MSLIFIERHENFSIYRRPDGTLAYLAHVAPFEHYSIDLYEVKDEWDLWPNMDRDAFMAFLRAVLPSTPYNHEADEVKWCDDCDDLTLLDDGRHLKGDDVFVCERCCDISCYYCDECNEYVREANRIDGEYFCESCTDNRFSWCSDCEEYYADDDYGHDHSEDPAIEGTCCASPVNVFVVPNGESPLANDTRVEIGLAAGTIDNVGISRIETYLYGEGLHLAGDLVSKIAPQWQMRTGNFTKRLSSALYKANGDKIPANILSMIGTIAREHSSPVSYHIETTRELNMGPEEFYNEDSCWWDGYAYSRCTLKTNGGFGLRSFAGDHKFDDVTGRAWVMPLRSVEVDGPPTLRATFNTQTPDAYVVFNCYGELEGYTAARILAHMTGLTYRKINFTMSGRMYVNGDTAYLVAPEEIANTYTDGYLRIPTEIHSDLYVRERADEVLAATAKELVNA